MLDKFFKLFLKYKKGGLNSLESIDLSQVKILKNNSVYRYGDVINRNGIRWKEDRETILSDPVYKNTVLFDYLTRKQGENDFATLKEVAWEQIKRRKISGASSYELVIHMRLGDIMGTDRKPELQRRQRAENMYNNFFEAINIDKIGISGVTIVTALHFGANIKNNLYFFNEKAKEVSFGLIKLLEKQCHQKGLNVRLQSSEDVDEDFLFMVASRNYVLGQTPFSTLVAKCMGSGANIYDLEKSKNNSRAAAS